MSWCFGIKADLRVWWIVVVGLQDDSVFGFGIVEVFGVFGIVV